MLPSVAKSLAHSSTRTIASTQKDSFNDGPVPVLAEMRGTNVRKLIFSFDIVGIDSSFCLTSP